MKKVKTSDHFRAASDRWSVESSDWFEFASEE